MTKEIYYANIVIGGDFMQRTDDIYFEDKSFPVKIRLGSTSVIDDVGDATRALHEAIEIKYFYEGESTLLIGTKAVHARAGDVIVINPYEVHGTVDYGKEEKGKYHLIMVGLDLFGGKDGTEINLRHLIFGKKTVFKTQFKNNKKMQEIMTRVAEEANISDALSRLSIFGLLAQLFSILLRDGTEDQEVSQRVDMVRYYTIIEPAIRMIRDDYSKHFSIDELAYACNISKFHFCRIFKAVMGVGAIQYLNEYRLKIADALLTNTDRQIGEIAVLCGFEDQSYFSRIYKKYFGCTPKSSKER